jgi:hypothetical protein
VIGVTGFEPATSTSQIEIRFSGTAKQPPLAEQSHDQSLVHCLVWNAALECELEHNLLRVNASGKQFKFKCYAEMPKYARAERLLT